jgi:hypothetical protein
MRCIAAIVEALPGMYIEVAESAQSGESWFIRWILHASGEHGPSSSPAWTASGSAAHWSPRTGIVFDTAAFEARSGKSVPWV